MLFCIQMVTQCICTQGYSFYIVGFIVSGVIKHLSLLIVHV